MPLLVALDEYNAALNAIAAHAEIGLLDPSSGEAALRIISSLCHKTNESVADTLTYATDQIASLMYATTSHHNNADGSHRLRCGG